MPCVADGEKLHVYHAGELPPQVHGEGNRWRYQQVMTYNLAQKIGLAVALLLVAGAFTVPAPPELSLAAWQTALIGLGMAVLWMTEPIPIPATALLPLVCFPLLGIGSPADVAAPYANPVIFLFLGGFFIAIAMEKSALHRRIAFTIIVVMGGGQRRMIFGFMVATAFLSMWVSNTATVLMMLPIAASVVEVWRGDGRREIRPGVVMMLAIAYSASIGGLGTLIGTPPNALLAGFLSETYGIEISFARWMLMGVPLVLVGLGLAYLVLMFLFPMEKGRGFAAGAEVRGALQGLGPMKPAEWRVAGVFIVVAFGWVTGDWIRAHLLPGLSDAAIALTGALALFLLTDGKRGRLLVWEDAVKIPWGVLLLFGGGLSLASSIESTGLADWLGLQVTAFGGWPQWAVLFVVVGMIILLTELTSNTATAAAFLPVTASVAVGLGLVPTVLAIPAALAASCAFMLPVATPPNAIVYASGWIRMRDMIRAGFVLNAVFAVLIVVLMLVWNP